MKRTLIWVPVCIPGQSNLQIIKNWILQLYTDPLIALRKIIQKMCSLINDICKKQGNTLILGDFNLPHSLTHCCAWHAAEGRSVLHIERSWPAIQAAPTDSPVSSSNCCSQFLRGRPGERFQSAAGGVPVWASIDSCSASGRRQMWPNNEWRMSAIRDW